MGAKFIAPRPVLSSAPRTIAILGDSIAARNNSAPAAGQSFSSAGPLAWAQIKLRNRIEFDGSLNFGVSGETSTQVLARLPLMLAAKPDICIIEPGTNDYPGVADPKVTVGNLITMLDKTKKAGIVPIWTPITPRAIASSNAQFICSVNRQVRQWCRKNSVRIADVSTAWIDPTTGAPKAGLTIDGLHPNVQGARLIGDVLAATLDPIVPLDDGLIYNPLDVYDATINPYGALNDNPLCTGTNGVKLAGATGEYLSSWNSQLNGNPTWTGSIVYSKETPTDGLGEWQKVTFTNFVTASAGQVFQFYNKPTSLPSSSILPGVLFDAKCDFEVTSNAGGFIIASIATTDFDGSTNRGVQSSAGGTSTDTCGPPGTLWSGVLRTPVQPMRPNTGAASSTMQSTIQGIIDGTYPGGANFALRWRRYSTAYRPPY